MQAGIPVHCLDMPRGRVTWKGLRTLWRILRTSRPDVVQTWMYHADFVGGVVARLAGFPRVFWGIRHSDLETRAVGRSTVLVVRACALLSRRIPERVICCAESAARVHAAIGYRREKLVVIPNGYDFSKVRPDPAARRRLRAEWGVADGLPLFGMVGRFNPQKDHRNLVDALGMLLARGVDFRCVLAGEGVTRENVELFRWLQGQGLEDRVILLGSRSDVPDVMNALDLHVLSSGSGEAFPNVLAEAMACGTPCVTTDVGDAASIVGDTGWVVPARSPEALAEALHAATLLLHQRGAQWEARQLACRARIESRYGIDRMVSAFRSVWRQEAGTR